LKKIIDSAPHYKVSKDQDNHQNNHIWSAKELMSKQFQELKWIVPNLLPEGAFLFAGAPKKGKSRIAIAIGVAVALGGVAFGGIKVQSGKVLYLSLEDGERRLKKRLQSMLHGHNIPDNLYLSSEWPSFDHGGLSELEKWIDSHPDTRLIVVDTLKRVRPAGRPNAAVYDNDYDAVAPLTELAQRHKIGILIVHHTRKQGSEDPFEMVSGSLGLTGAADGVIVLRSLPRGAGTSLHIVGRDVEEKEVALTWDKDQFTWIIRDNIDEFKRSEERNQIIDLLTAKGALSPKKISQLLNREGSATRKLLSAMLKDGELIRPKSGVYSVPDKDGNSGNSGNFVGELF
jgi:RecA-family ATPase